MVCAKCQKLAGTTQLATPGVKRKSEIYHGSPASGSGIGNNTSSSKNKTSATLGNTGISKSKLLGKPKNPYATLSIKCRDCNAKTEGGKKLCHRCAYKANACAMCGKSETKKIKDGVPTIQGQKFSAK
ncbi:MAG: hypothetical protein GOMPHAMPRED_006301 [Gomphillus americanus]|uniref:Cysteine-rich PDZ-binding protein n=1 Tax=Gomphillus americanus TaxID=1940652 RepID=A0A8H3EQR4_9LECA|nr:MAG: hypothetical protein GOMPHAMPRED_006301 [Gomphillus americanus]